MNQQEEKTETTEKERASKGETSLDPGKCTRNAAKRQQQHEQVPGHVDCRRRRRRRPGAGTPNRMLEHLAQRLPLQDQNLGQRTPRRSAPAQGA